MAAAQEQNLSLKEGAKEGAIVDNYQIGQEIGRGGMAVVFKAFDMSLERKVAIKFLNQEQATNEKAVIRFQREALVAGQIGHENICDVRGRGIAEDGTPYIVMEYLEGEDLSSLLKRKGQIEPKKTTEILLQVLSALEAVHQAGIVHRDLKPENIFLTEKLGGGEQVKLLDFGISFFLRDDKEMRLTHTGTVNGTPYYMSYEQARGCRDVDHHTDIWSVGVILYEMLTGELPFDGENYNEVLASVLTKDVPDPSVINPEISRAMTNVVLKAMAKNRDERFDSTVEFASALSEAMVDESISVEISAPAESQPELEPEEAPKKRWGFMAAGAGAVLVILMGVLSLYLGLTHTPATPQQAEPEPAAVATFPDRNFSDEESRNHSKAELEPPRPEVEPEAEPDQPTRQPRHPHKRHSPQRRVTEPGEEEIPPWNPPDTIPAWNPPADITSAHPPSP